MKYSNALPGMHFDVDFHSSGWMRAAISWAVGLWFVAALIGGMMNIFYQPGVPPLMVGLFVLIPILGFVFAYRESARVRLTLDALPLWGITLAHIWRFVGLGFVLGAVMETLPVQFGYPEGLGDVITALFAVPLALALRDGGLTRNLRNVFVAWNIFGLVDLLSAITLGVLYSPSSFGILRTGISTGLMTRFPVSLIPTFFLPLFILLHLLALKRRKELVGSTK